MGMRTMLRGQREDSKLTLEGGAEMYWALFIEPLQR
jgi:hypothetical protein